MDELLPCPCCGATALLETWKARKGYEASITCNNCLLSMLTITYDTEEEAVVAATEDWNRRAEQPNEPRWIPVSERLPEVDKYGDVNVLVHFDDGFINSATYDKNNGWELWADAGEVTHWMYHPEPPEVYNET